MELNEILNQFVRESIEIFKSNLVGVYLHGSLAMGCFNPDKSDIDLLLVVEDEISWDEKKRFMDFIVGLNKQGPAKGIEMSIVKRKYCENFIHPTPYELHFSVMHLNLYRNSPQGYIERMKGTDRDLAAHFVITKKRGITLYGRSIDDIFGEVPKEAYIDSIKFDVEDAHNKILENPIYIILNLCRVLAYLRDSLILSKEEGGKWGIENVNEEYRGLVEEALNCYVTDTTMILKGKAPLDFCDYMRTELDFLKGSVVKE